MKKLSAFSPGPILAGCLLFLTGCTPYISSLDPGKGTVGSYVVIEGGNFGVSPAENTVKFGDISVPTGDISVLSEKQLRVRVPAGAHTGQVSVITSKGTGISSSNFIVDTANGAKWTFMVYLDADNNLEGAGIDDFLEMAEVGSRNGVNVVVQMDRRAGYSTAYGDWKDTRRFLINNGSNPSGEPIQNMGELNMGDPATLSDFVEWAVTNYPAEHYALSVWNHGDGWRMSRMKMDTIMSAMPRGEQEPIVKAVASDDTDNDILFMREVQDALSAARERLEARNITNAKIDVLGFDACLMGMVEVAYAFRNEADFMTGSEELEPGEGWPYNIILEGLTDNPGMAPADLAKLIVTCYGNTYTNEVTQAAYDIGRVTDLAIKIDEFTGQAINGWDVIKSARINSRQYHPAWDQGCWGTDIWDFADRVNRNSSYPTIKNAAAELKSAVESFVIQEFHSSDMSGSHGVAIYFPPDLNSYNNDPQHAGYEQTNTFMKVDFVSNHQFDEWLKKYYSKIP